jgi:hypothetical protein
MEIGDGTVGQVIHRRRGILIALGAVMLAALAASYFAVSLLVPVPSSSVSSPSSSPTPTPAGPGGVPEDQHPGPISPPTGDGGVTPFVVRTEISEDQGSLWVFALVPGLAEEGGTCRATLTSHGSSATATGPAAIEVATTSCARLVVSLSGLQPGPAILVVEYESATVSGRSENAEVNLP